MNDRNEIIRIEGIRRDFRVGSETVHALRGVSFSIREGEFVTIMGTSGSGKSTLLNLLGCLDVPTSGEYYLDGVPVRRMSGNERATLRNRKIGFVFQSYNLLPQFSAWENVAMPLQIRGIPLKDRKERAMEILDLVGLRDHALHKPTELSGGQQQRIGIARAIVTGPAIVFADEPTGNLDSRTGQEVMELLGRIFRKWGTTFILVSHDEEMYRYTDREIRLKDGKIEQQTLREERML